MNYSNLAFDMLYTYLLRNMEYVYDMCPVKGTTFLIPPPVNMASYLQACWKEQPIKSVALS